MSRYQRLIPVVNACLMTMIIFGTFATINNIDIVLGGDRGLTVFKPEPGDDQWNNITVYRAFRFPYISYKTEIY